MFTAKQNEIYAIEGCVGSIFLFATVVRNNMGPSSPLYAKLFVKV